MPFTPTYAEYIYLKGRRVLADQMEYLLTHFPRTSPLHARLRDALAEVNARELSAATRSTSSYCGATRCFDGPVERFNAPASRARISVADGR